MLKLALQTILNDRQSSTIGNPQRSAILVVLLHLLINLQNVMVANLVQSHVILPVKSSQRAIFIPVTLQKICCEYCQNYHVDIVQCWKRTVEVCNLQSI